MNRFVQVLVDCVGIEEPLTYAVPVELSVQVGDILSVPLANRTVGAIALECTDSSAIPEPKPVLEVVGRGLFSPEYWLLLQMTASYYATPLIQTLRCALPPQLLQRSPYRHQLIACPLPQFRDQLSPAGLKVWQLFQEHGDISHRYLQQSAKQAASAGLRELRAWDCIRTYIAQQAVPQPKWQEVVVLTEATASSLTPRQQEILHILRKHDGELPKMELIKLAKTSDATLQKLQAQGCLVILRREVWRLAGQGHPVSPDQPKSLTPAQASALQQIRQYLNQCQTFLLDGVTGSGKTEVYLQAIAEVIGQGKSALVLVPEIGLTPQLTDRFRARFGDRLVLQYHSQLADGERFDTWRRMLCPEPQIVIGTRSAVFAPLPNLGIIILDEEHDASFKQEQTQPCYHARLVSQWRSQLASIPLVLGSATPSAEMLRAQQQGKLIHLPLPQRIGNRPLPPITVVDMRQELAQQNYSIFSRCLQAAITDTIAQQQQIILFIHRRGFNTFVSCRWCGHVLKCPHCDVSLTYHLSPPLAEQVQNPAGSLLCHYCGYRQAKPSRCPVCQSTAIKHFGSGTQKVEQELRTKFPHLRIIRFDSDTTRNKDQHRLLLEEFRCGKADVLIGTQMLTKGLDIPQVTLVGIVSADGLLNFSDYRAGERAIQTLLQVAGRCGRGDRQGRVILQTYTPEHPAIVSVQNYDYHQFLHSELQHRASLNYPPFGTLVLIRLSSPRADLVQRSAEELAQWLREHLGDRCQVLGASPAPIALISDRWRWQIMLKLDSADHSSIPSLSDLRKIINNGNVRIGIDIDPLHIT